MCMSKSFRNSMILSSVVLLLLGLTLIIWPTASQRIICFVAGALCVVIGLSRIIAQWKLSRDFGFQISYLFGILVLLVGLLLIIKADAMIALFGTLVGLVLTVDSIVKLQMSFQMRALSLPRWSAHAISAAVLLVIGIVLLFDPFSGAKAMATCMGVALLIDAIANLWTVIDMRKNIVES